ncbi:hypothetical protein AbraIFM66950_007341 [Aspergillus brasiliensis]|nr:hypothetical protein AbraIFM66950_007341 [Aspergillus brasiliensis]
MASAASGNDAESTIADDNLQTPDAKEETEDVSIYCSGATWHMAPELCRIRERDEAGGEKLKLFGVAYNKRSETKTIIDNSFGCVKPEEMLLVLGRPGAQCTSLLNVLSNNCLGYKEVAGDVSFGSMSAKEAKQYRS